ncbi:hypothetical protein AX17_005012 [Amanita inopinata Kibby_2008]|nr:hypothetical protein AX17_005012 [Amanita inopinata Kibby_2008]
MPIAAQPLPQQRKSHHKINTSDAVTTSSPPLPSAPASTSTSIFYRASRVLTNYTRRSSPPPESPHRVDHPPAPVELLQVAVLVRLPSPRSGAQHEPSDLMLGTIRKRIKQQRTS